MTKHLFSYFFLFILLAACSISPENSLPTVANNAKLRAQQLAKIDTWKINGKIAFLQKTQRSSASLVWQRTNANEQFINLSTYLGINVLTLESKNGSHLIEIDGKTYQGNNLAQMISELTQINFPTQALTFWLKGLVFSPADQLVIDPVSQLPKTLNSYYNNLLWQISYQEYEQYQDFFLAKIITIKQADLTIKISINQWEI